MSRELQGVEGGSGNTLHVQMLLRRKRSPHPLQEQDWWFALQAGYPMAGTLMVSWKKQQQSKLPATVTARQAIAPRWSVYTHCGIACGVGSYLKMALRPHRRVWLLHSLDLVSIQDTFQEDARLSVSHWDC